MKKILILLLCVAFVACQKEVKKDYALFSGKVTGKAKELNISGNGFKQNIPINSDGTFSDTLKIEVDGYYDYNIGRERSAIYLTKGADLNLTIDTKEFDESIVYTGIGSGENNFLAQKYLKIEEMSGDYKDFYSLEPEAYKKKSSDIQAAVLDLLKSNKNLSPDFVESETLSNTYAHLNRLNQYEGAHKYYTKKEEVTLPGNFLEEANGIDFLDENKYKTIPEYKDLAINHLYSSLGELKDKYKDDADTYKGLKELVAKLPANSKIKEDFLHSMSYGMSPSGDLEGLYAVLKTTPNTEYQKLYEKNYNKFKTLVKGKPSPSFNYENYKGGSTSLTDLKGKYVYVDVWATWCGPCKREIPFLKEVEEKYHDKNVEFVSISIDNKKDYETWRKMIEDKELGGTQLFVDKDWKSDFVVGYGINGIPRFILIDPDGNIVNADAPRPSNPKLTELFEELKI